MNLQLFHALAPRLGLKSPPAVGKWAEIRSPLRADDATPSFSVAADYGDGAGYFKDHGGTGENGTLVDLCIRLGVEVPPMHTRASRAPSSFAEWCASRSLDPERLKPAFDIAEGGGSFEFPAGTGRRWRKLAPKGEGQKTGWVKGRGVKGTVPYGFGQALATLGKGGVLYVVNGEPSVWACWQSGVAALCTCSSETTPFSADQAIELAKLGVPVRVVYDLDDAGRIGAAKQVDALKAGGVVDVAALELPPDLGEKGDVDDLHRLVGDAGLLEALTALGPLPEDDPDPTAESAERAAWAKNLIAGTGPIATADLDRLFDEIATYPESHRGAIRAALMARVGGAKMFDAGVKEAGDRAKARTAPKSAPSDGNGDSPWKMDEKGTWQRRWKGQSEDAPVFLANFTAKIAEGVRSTDGVEDTSSFAIDVTRGGRVTRAVVPCEQFGNVSRWALEADPYCIVQAGEGTREKLRVAIHETSIPFPNRRSYRHTGWIQREKRWVYLTGNGAIGLHDGAEAIECDLPTTMKHWGLPEPDDSPESIRAILALFEVASPEIAVPLLCAPFRAVLGRAVDFVIHVSGTTGYGKSSITALLQRFFAPETTPFKLPHSWQTTRNGLEIPLHAAKDSLLVVDDYKPGSGGGARSADDMRATFNWIVSSIGNESGKHRQTKDGRQRDARPPRGLVLSTGEELGRGESNLARSFSVDVDREIWPKVAVAEKALGRMPAAVMAAFVGWLAQDVGERQRIEAVWEALPEDIGRRRDSIEAAHGRIKSNNASLFQGARWLLAFAVDRGAIDGTEAARLERSWWQAMLKCVVRQNGEISEEKPTTRFLGLLRGVIQAGKAHLRDSKGEACPKIKVDGVTVNARLFGWETSMVTTWNGTEKPVEKPLGSWVGVVTAAGGLLIDPDTCYAAVTDHAGRENKPFIVEPAEVWKRFCQEGLARWAPGEKRKALSSLQYAGTKKRVLPLQLGLLLSTDEVPKVPKVPPVDNASDSDTCGTEPRNPDPSAEVPKVPGGDPDPPVDEEPEPVEPSGTSPFGGQVPPKPHADQAHDFPGTFGTSGTPEIRAQVPPFTRRGKGTVSIPIKEVPS